MREMISIEVRKTREYAIGDLMVAENDDGTRWLAEVLEVHNSWYRARMTPLKMDEQTGKYHVSSPDFGTFSGVQNNQIRKFRLDEIDFQSLAEWQKYVEKDRARSQG